MLALWCKVISYFGGDSETSSERQVFDSDNSEQAYAWYDGLDTSTKLSTG